MTEEQGKTPQARNPAADPDHAPEKQSELKLNVGIGVLGTALSIGVALIFFFVLEDIVLGIVFAVVALVALAITLRVASRKRNAKPQQKS
jgi:flagellar basal body-associated protein FliL